MAQKVLALNTKGDLTYCSVDPDKRGRGRCNHVEHQNPGESVEDFIQRIENKQKELIENNNFEENYNESKTREITQEEIDSMAEEIDRIAGTRLTVDNFKEVLSSLSADKVHEIAKIAFNSAPEFSLPVTDEEYDDENIKNKLYFANLPAYGISGNKDSFLQMFDKIGDTPTLDGSEHIAGNYKDGLTPGEYFLRQYSARDASINKSVSTAKPGFCIYENSLVEVKDEFDKLERILWKDVRVGNEFVDGSIVEEIQDWQIKECYEILMEDSIPVIISHDHLLFGEIFINNKPVENLEKSYKARQNVGENDPKWICAEDIYEMYSLGAKVILSDTAEIKYIKPVGERKVRCISTSTGFYATNGLIHHNTARKLFYAMSDTQVYKDCGGPYIDALHCNMPEGHVCEKCAQLTQGGKNVKAGQLIGGKVSTHLSEAITQLSMKQKHVGSGQVANQLNHSNVIMATLDGWGTSSIIQKVREVETSGEKRQVLFDELKAQYKEAGIKQDDFNIMMVARKLTSYRRTPEGLVPVKPDEKSDVVSMMTIGNANNIFKTAELSVGYKHLTVPQKQKLGTDAANQILR